MAGEAPRADGDAAADARTLAALELGAVLAHVAGFASTPLGAARVRGLVPRAVRHDDAPARDAIRAEHDRVGAMRAVLAADAGWPAEPVPDLNGAIDRLAVPGSTWTALQVRDARILLRSSRVQAAALHQLLAGGGSMGRAERPADAEAARQRFAPLAELRAALLTDARLETALERVVDDDGVVRDGASPELRRVRRHLRGAEADLVRLLEKVMRGLEAHHRVEDASVTMRNGRWVIPVRREGRAAVGGIVHDASASGATVFVEPPAAVEFANRIRELEAEEAREVERVLREATDLVRPRAADLAAALEALVALDSLAARARFADRYGCAPAAFCAPADGMTVVAGRHPLLVAQAGAAAAAPAVVPFSLALASGERTLLVSGPNTGGKTVLLKAIGLLSLMAQTGVPPTVGPGSVIPLFDRVFADIGDEQSIEASLSTFSGHVRNLIEIAERATADSLVLADELGSGTDPLEGAALGGALLEALTRRGSTTVATTHLGALKELAHEVAGVVNASLQFDDVGLAPTYELLKGIPGRSYGLRIARRLRMPEEILARAEARVPEAERRAAALIEDLERRQRDVERRERATDEREERSAARDARLAEREHQVRMRERDLEREAREASRKYVLEARRELEGVIAAVKAAAHRARRAGRGAPRDDGRRGDEGGGPDQPGAPGALTTLDDAVAAARRVAENVLAAERAALRGLEAGGGARAAGAGAPGMRAVAVGDYVRVESLAGATAQVLEVRGDQLVVAAGSIRITVSAAEARPVPARDGPRARSTREARVAREPVSIAGEMPEVTARPEIDVRGLRIGEVDGAVQVALDNAVRADLPTLRIIHGKGTGALRERVGELLRGDPRVRSHRLGAWNEGGAGVTVAELA